jgi:hypothetical protein
MTKQKLLRLIGILFVPSLACSIFASETNVFNWNEPDYGISLSVVGPYNGARANISQGERTGNSYIFRTPSEPGAVIGYKYVAIRFAPKNTNDPPLEFYSLKADSSFNNLLNIIVESKKPIFVGAVPAFLFTFTNNSEGPTGDLFSKGRGYWIVADANGLRYKILAFDAKGGNALLDVELGSVLKTLKITDMHGQPPPVDTDPPRYKHIDFSATSLTTFGVTLGETFDALLARAAKQSIFVMNSRYEDGNNTGMAQFQQSLDGSTSALMIFAQYHDGIIDKIEVVTRDDYFFKYLRDELNHRTNSTVTMANGEYTLKLGGYPVRISMAGGEGRQDHIFFSRDDLITKAIEAYERSQRSGK